MPPKTCHKYLSNTGIAPTEGFKKKRLAALAVNIGNACEFGCSYCYVPDMPFQHSSIKVLRNQGLKREDFSNYRVHDDLISAVERDIKKFRPGDTSTVFFCTTCDPCATAAHVEMTTTAAKVILENSDLRLRILSKSTNIIMVAQALSGYKERVSYGLSTGTCIPEISKAIETNASPINDRVKALHWLQDEDYRTYGMICPILPSEKGRIKELVDQVRPEKCEYVWAEAINDKGSSLINTFDALAYAGLACHASAIKDVMTSKKNWQEYTAELFTAIRSDMEKRNMLGKLRFLQYTTKSDLDFFSLYPEAVCL